MFGYNFYVTSTEELPVTNLSMRSPPPLPPLGASLLEFGFSLRIPGQWFAFR
jgi:hypothetical protein